MKRNGKIVNAQLTPMIEGINSILKLDVELQNRNGIVWLIEENSLDHIIEKYGIEFDGVETYNLTNVKGKVCSVYMGIDGNYVFDEFLN